MSCATVINYDCETRIGETMTGHRYEFSPEIGDPVPTELEVHFHDRYDGKIDELDFTVGNLRLVQTGTIWEMQPLIIPTTIEPGKYSYHVRVTYDNGNIETLFTGSKTFTK